MVQQNRQIGVVQSAAAYRDALGRRVQAFAAVVPDVGRHAGLLAGDEHLIAGNDQLMGDGGDDRIVGDHSALLAAFQEGFEGVLDDLAHAGERLTFLERALPPAPGPTFAVASDVILGGAGDDVLIGDMFLGLTASAVNVGALPAGLEQAADDFDDAVDAFAQKVKTKPAALGFTTSRDTIRGGDGNDTMVGDHVVSISLAVDGPAGAGVSTAWLDRVRRSSLTLDGDKDVLEGEGGADVIIGDVQVSVLVGVGASPFAEVGSAAPTGDELPGTSTAYVDIGDDWVTPALAAPATAGAGFHTVEIEEVLCTLTIHGAEDSIDGGAGDDLAVGDASVRVQALVHGPFATLEPGVAHPDLQLVHVDGLVGEVQMVGARDTLLGGGDDDVLIGDHEAVVAGVFQGPALVVGAGQGSTRTRSWQHDEELVHFSGLVDCLSLEGAGDTIDGNAGADELIGDHRVLVSALVEGPVLKGTAAATGFTSEHRFETPVEFSELVSHIQFEGGDDAVHGGADTVSAEGGNDVLVGDTRLMIAGIQRGPALLGPASFVAQAAYQHPYWEALVDFDGLVGSVDSCGGNDTLSGDVGNDLLTGDDVVVVVGLIAGDLAVAQGGGTASLPAKKIQDTALVEFDKLVGSIDLHGGRDTLSGGLGNDALAGDHRLAVAGVQQGAVFVAGATLAVDLAANVGRLSCEAQADFDCLVDCVRLEGGDDYLLDGGSGNDTLTGDHVVDIVAAVREALVVGTTGAPPATITSSSQSEALVEFDRLVGSLDLCAGKDTVTGGEGDDRLIGDSEVNVAAGLLGQLAAGAGGPAPTAATAMIDVVRIEQLVGCVSIGAERDTLSGGAGDDLLIGDNAVSLRVAIHGDGTADAAVTPRAVVESLIGDVCVSAAADTLRGDDGDDCLLGDQALDAWVSMGGAGRVDGARIEIESLAGRVTLGAGDDRLEGGNGDDLLIGDSRAVVAGVVVDSEVPDTRALAIGGLLCELKLDAGCDTLLGAVGDDELIGDNFVSVAGVMVRESMSGHLDADIGRLIGRLTLDARGDTLDGGEGFDTLIGDQRLQVAGILDAAAAGGSSGSGSIDLTVCELIDCVELRAGNDRLLGGAAEDLMIGDSVALFAAFAGGFSVPLAAELRLTGVRLVEDVDVRAGSDTVLGGEGNDELVGDNEVRVATVIPGTLQPGVYGVGAVIDDLSVSSASDSLDGQAGDDIKSDGNRVVAPRPLVKRSWVSQASSTAPVIDWNGKLCLDAASGERPGWLSEFVNALAQGGNPNDKIRVKL